MIILNSEYEKKYSVKKTKNYTKENFQSKLFYEGYFIYLRVNQVQIFLKIIFIIKSI